MTLSRGQKLRPSHPLTRLTAYLDHQGVLRVGGRLKFAQLDNDSKHQAISPKGSQFVQLIIQDAHLRTLHGGTQLTLGQLRRSYWTVGGKAPVKSLILKCVPCARQRGVRAQQLMGLLPVVRLTPGPAFLNTGIDYDGPVSLRSWRGRGHKSCKGWLAIFVCMDTSAVHLEVVSDYTSDDFMAAYRRFVAQRGLCGNLFSHCGTNFLGDGKEIKNLFSMASKESDQLVHLLLNDVVSCSSPSSTFQAQSSREQLFRRPPSDVTTGAQSERTTRLFSQPQMECAAFNHYQRVQTLPEPSLDQLNIARLTRWPLIRQKVQSVWNRWSTSYLQHLQSISKWHHPSHDIKIGSIVLLTEERFPPTKWPLARVIALHPGKDGLTKVVAINTSSSTLQRPIAKRALLPMSISDF
ncbi:uncharacterized protein [Fopius arisanus]|uniref:DUF5641 domain-containing protein n=1 Tax=Fopius arisanus TaxID=64838 RepID=A0A9R1TM63_9HYME|nr:PREDICTED: uncharacterized protein LOC105271706 [Fopius arisanus]